MYIIVYLLFICYFPSLCNDFVISFVFFAFLVFWCFFQWPWTWPLEKMNSCSELSPLGEGFSQVLTSNVELCAIIPTCRWSPCTWNRKSSLNDEDVHVLFFWGGEGALIGLKKTRFVNRFQDPGRLQKPRELCRANPLLISYHNDFMVWRQSNKNTTQEVNITPLQWDPKQHELKTQLRPRLVLGPYGGLVWSRILKT